jgi:hypothetical protein
MQTRTKFLEILKWVNMFFKSESEKKFDKIGLFPKVGSKILWAF